MDNAAVKDTTSLERASPGALPLHPLHGASSEIFEHFS